jgi:hypothetical protein
VNVEAGANVIPSRLRRYPRSMSFQAYLDSAKFAIVAMTADRLDIGIKLKDAAPPTASSRPDPGT